MTRNASWVIAAVIGTAGLMAGCRNRSAADPVRQDPHSLAGLRADHPTKLLVPTHVPISDSLAPHDEGKVTYLSDGKPLVGKKRNMLGVRPTDPNNKNPGAVFDVPAMNDTGAL